MIEHKTDVDEPMNERMNELAIEPVIELGDVSTQTKGGVEHMIEDRDPLV